MKTAQFAYINAVYISATLAGAALAASLIYPRSILAAAGGQQICEPSSSCEVGEFLYDDSYTPITGATCTITARYPDGTSYLSSQALTGQSDGWYSYTFTSSSTEGMYRSTICCDTGGDHMCLDKTFEIRTNSSASVNNDDIAAAVWGYSSRTLSGFGNLISDIWSFATRNVTGGSVTTTTSSTTTAQLDDLQATVEETRNLIEKVVNKPIIQTSIEETPDLTEKLDQSKSVTNNIYADTQYLQSGLLALASRWNKLSEEEIWVTLEDFKDRLGNESDAELADSLWGQLNWMNSNWKWENVEKIKDSLKLTEKSLLSLENSFDKNGKSTVSYQAIKGVTKNIASLDNLVGSSLDNNKDNTLFGSLAAVILLSQNLDAEGKDLDGLLANWNSLSLEQKNVAIKDSNKKVLEVNKIASLKNFFKLSSNLSLATPKELQNKILGFKGIVVANIQLLAQKPDNSLVSTWLELGSIVFKTVATNPSTRITQDVEVKYYLPEEVKEEHIIKVDDGLKVEFDAETNKYYVSGKYNFKPGETKTLSVSVQDIWAMTDDQMDSLRKQAADLARPLEKTALFAQGVTLTSDINASLDRIVVKQKAAITPEAKIRAYRENEIELNAVNDKLNKLRDLVASVSSTGSLLGFIGGAQTLAVWGLIIILVAGFVFLALYMRVIRGHEKKEVQPKKKKLKLATHIASYVIFGILVSGLTTLVIKSNPSAEVITSAPVQQQVLGDQKEELQEASGDLGKGGPKIVRVLVPRGNSVKVYKDADIKSLVLSEVEESLKVTEIQREDGWVNTDKGWIQAIYVEEGSEEDAKLVMVSETPTGFLRVRATPGGAELIQVKPGTGLTYIDENTGWYQVELEDGSLGWVSKQYSSVN